MEEQTPVLDWIMGISEKKLTGAYDVLYAVHDGFVDINIAVSDFKIETTFRISTDPLILLLNSRPWLPKSERGTKYANLAFLACWKINFVHYIHLPDDTKNKLNTVYHESL